MNRSHETRLRKLENERAGDTTMALIVVDPNETYADAAARYFGRSGQSQTGVRVTYVHTGVARSKASLEGMDR